MRVTQSGVTRKVINTINDRYESLSKLQESMTSGKSVSRPSDNPMVTSELLQLASDTRRIGQFVKNAQLITQEMQTAESAVSQVTEVLSVARTKALAGANDAMSANDRKALAIAVDGEIKELLGVANQKYNGKYLLGGTKIDRPPYVITTDGEGKITAITSSQDSVLTVQLAVGDGLRVDASVGSDDLFNTGDGDNLFQVLLDLRDALNNSDVDTINGTLDRLSIGIDQTTSTTAMIGARINLVDSISQRHSDLKTSTEQRISELSDADAVEVISRYNQEQAVYQMALKTAVNLIQPTLVNFV